MAKRIKLEIIRDILKIVEDNYNSIKKTPLIRKSNLSSQRFNKYFNELLDKSFIIESADKKSGKVILLTDKGKKYLEKYMNIVGFIEEFGL